MKQLLILCVLALGGAAVAQDAADPPPPTPPPLVPTDAPTGDVPGAPPPAVTPADATGVLRPTAIANPPLPPDGAAVTPAAPTTSTPAAAPADEPGFFHRVLLETAFGAGVGLVGALAGALLGQRLLAPNALSPLGPGWGGAAIGFAALMPVGVIGAGGWNGGRGSVLATLAGDVAGLVVGVLGANASGGTDAMPLVLGLPLAGALIGYESTNAGTPTPAGPPRALAPSRGTVLFSVGGTF